MFNIRIFSDFAWPFCYFGLGLVNKLMDDGIECNVEWIPFELDPNAPLEGMDLFTVYPKNYVVNSINHLNKLGRDLNIKYNNINSKFNTRRAHLAGYYAKDKDKYDEYSNAVFKAYFGEKLNVADVDVLNKIADSVGLNIVEMNAAIDSDKYNSRLTEDYRLANEYSIRSVPTFIINEETIISGIKEYDEFKEYFLEQL